ncbi:MAG: hypothetical protein KatS3mg031_0122 [Chitinophagales bacterium]|nr:MAG: hypothetical protein KatS3mg031_0122 [Chitinophagales bacterium]
MIVCTVLLSAGLFAQKTSEEPKPVMTFETETIDYGTIIQDSDGAREFKFTNTGNAPLIINNCQGTCGCTVPNCPKNPIQPGESATIGVKYATNRLGQFNKGIKIYSNATPADQPIMIYIKGNVLPKDAGVKQEGTKEDHTGHNH